MILIKNGRVFPMCGEPFSGDVLIDGGKITQAGGAINAADAEVFDASGMFVLPGLIDAHCHIGMWEDGMGDEGADGNEYSDPLTPQLYAVDGLNPFDPCFAEACAAGVTTAVTGPGSANVIGGQFAAVKTHGRCLDDMLLKNPVAMKAAVGENPKRIYGEQKAAPYTRMAIASLFRKAMSTAMEYRDALERAKADPDKKPDLDLSSEALLPVLNRELPMKIHAHRADDILTALRLAKEYGIRVTIEHCTEGHLITGVLKEYLAALGAGIIIGPLISERSKVELRNLSVRAPKILEDAGIPFAIMTDHPVIPIQYLPLCAAVAVREGLSERAALEAITKNAAEIVGIADRVGTLEPGKDADIAIFDGHPLDYRTHCVRTYINGTLAYDIEQASAKK